MGDEARPRPSYFYGGNPAVLGEKPTRRVVSIIVEGRGCGKGARGKEASGEGEMEGTGP